MNTLELFLRIVKLLYLMKKINLMFIIQRNILNHGMKKTFDIRAWIDETLSKPYNPKTITFLDIMNSKLDEPLAVTINAIV